MIRDKEFVFVWQEGKTLGDVAERFKISKAYASRRAAWFRNRGVKLKKFYTPKKPVDIKELNAIAAKSLKP